MGHLKVRTSEQEPNNEEICILYAPEIQMVSHKVMEVE